MDIKEDLACPKCKAKLHIEAKQGTCQSCKKSYFKKEDIWDLLYPGTFSKKPLKEYDHMHNKDFGGPSDGSYEILASFAKGNKAVDIACGEGLIEKLSRETVAVEFSLKALKKARRNGAKHLVLADAHYLPFVDNTFDIAISSGNLEHFANPKKAIKEMGRIAKIQIIVFHKTPPLPFANMFHSLVTSLLKIKHQPLEHPLPAHIVEEMIQKAGLHIVYKGVWTLPVNYGKVIKWLPELKKIPSCGFIISIKK